MPHPAKTQVQSEAGTPLIPGATVALYLLPFKLSTAARCNAVMVTAHIGCSDGSPRMRDSSRMDAGSCRCPKQYAASCRSSSESSFSAAQSRQRHEARGRQSTGWTAALSRRTPSASACLAASPAMFRSEKRTLYLSRRLVFGFDNFTHSASTMDSSTMRPAVILQIARLELQNRAQPAAKPASPPSSYCSMLCGRFKVCAARW